MNQPIHSASPSDARWPTGATGVQVPDTSMLPGSGRLVDEELSADLSNLRSFYLLEGFDQSRVGPARIEEKGDRLQVVVPIVEGRRRMVGELVLEDVAPLDEAKVRVALPLKDDGPFHRLLLERSVDTLRALLEDRGYGNAIVSSDVLWSADDLTATVRLRVFAGEQVVGHGLADHRDGGVAAHIGGREERAAPHAPGARQASLVPSRMSSVCSVMPDILGASSQPSQLVQVSALFEVHVQRGVRQRQDVAVVASWRSRYVSMNRNRIDNYNSYIDKLDSVLVYYGYTTNTEV